MSTTSRSDAIRVVVVDDDERARNALAALLSTFPSVEVVARAANGIEAVEATGVHRPDVVVMDVMMPGMDGVEAARRIKLQSPGVGVILLTLYSGVEWDAKKAGADAFMLKSDSGEEIVEAIHRLAGRRAPTEQPG